MLPKKSYIQLTQARKIGAKTARQLKGGEILALIGPLGAGKTTFVKALGKQLGIRHKITSPTFTLMHVFPVKLPKRRGLIYHLDLYRTKNFRETYSLGITETWGRPGTITVIEWADKILKKLPKKTRYLYFSHE